MKGIGNEVDESLSTMPFEEEDDPRAQKKTRIRKIIGKIGKKVNEMSFKVFPYKDALLMGELRK